MRNASIDTKGEVWPCLCRNRQIAGMGVEPSGDGHRKKKKRVKKKVFCQD